MGSLLLSPFFAVNQRKETAMQSIKDTYQREGGERSNLYYGYIHKRAV